MATKKDAKAAKAAKEVKTSKVSAEEKAAKRKARMEALKNRPAGQRPNSKQIDVIETENGTVKNYGHVVKAGGTILGVMVTSVAFNAKGEVVGTSVTFVPGNVTIKAKKGHGNFSKPKNKKEVEEDEEEDDED